LNPSTLLTQGEELPEPGVATAKATYEAELAKLRKEAEELAKAKKRLLAVQHEAEAAKEIQIQKAENAKLQEELCAMKAKQSLSCNQPSPKYTVPNQSNFTKCNEFFTQPPPHSTISCNPFVNPFESGPSHHDIHTIRTRSWDHKSPLSQEIQITPWPQTYRPVPLPRFSGQSGPRQFLMSYEAAILSAGGDDSVLVNSFIIAADEAAAQWYSLLSPSVIPGWDDLKQRILSNFQGFQRPELTESDLLLCKQKDKEPLQNYFRRFVHLRAQAPNVLDAVAINTAIVGLRAGQFRSHLMRERPKTIQRLYEEFEKYCRSDNDFRMCMEEQSQQKKSAKANQPSKREWSNPRNASYANPQNVFGLDGENTQESPNLQMDSQSLVSSLPSPPHSNQVGGRRGGRGGGRGRGRSRGRGHHENKNGTASSTRRTMITVQITAQTRNDSRPFSRKRGRRRRGPAP
jgi:hypothetical protein